MFWSQRLDAVGRRRGAENKGNRSANVAREGTMGRCDEADRLLGGLLEEGSVEDMVQDCTGELDRHGKRLLNRTQNVCGAGGRFRFLVRWPYQCA